MSALYKRILSACLIAVLCLGISACSGKNGFPSVLDGPENAVTVPAGSEDAPVSDESGTAETPDPETLPAEQGEADIEAGCEILELIYDRYFPGTAGSSLTAARAAAMLLDWYVSINAANEPEREMIAEKTGERFASDHDLDPGAETADGIPIDFPEKLRAIWSSAMALAFGDTAVLEDAGYTPVNTWSGVDADVLFSELYEGLSIDRGQYVLVYFPDDQASGLLQARIPVYMTDGDGILAALKTARIVPGEVELNSCEINEDGTAYLDLNGAFRNAVAGMGSAGEILTVESVAYTFMTALGAHRLRLTVDGAYLETGHNVYSDYFGYRAE